MSRKLILICVNCLNRNYSQTKNNFNNLKRLEIKKFCKHCNSHTIHKENR